jgi:hypothetical protein
MHASGFARLLAAMKHERATALKLATSRYVLATSVPMTVDRKAKLIEALQGVPLRPSGILGQEDLNNRLGRHPSVERKHFKLCLTSSTVLERMLNGGIYNQTAAELDVIKRWCPGSCRTTVSRKRNGCWKSTDV